MCCVEIIAYSLPTRNDGGWLRKLFFFLLRHEPPLELILSSKEKSNSAAHIIFNFKKSVAAQKIVNKNQIFNSNTFFRYTCFFNQTLSTSSVKQKNQKQSRISLPIVLISWRSLLSFWYGGNFFFAFWRGSKKLLLSLPLQINYFARQFNVCGAK